MKTARPSRLIRAALLASAAGFCLSLAAGSAQAATEDPISDGTLARPLLGNVVRESQSGGQNASFDVVREAQDDRSSIDALREAQLSGPTALPTVQRDPQIVIANPPAGPGQTPNTTVSDRDPVNITGVGQMIVDEQNGFIGLCTGTLINPRTVIFAAHCVNEEDATAYGNKSGGRPIAFGFSNNNNAAGNSAFGHYLNTGNTNQADFLYNVNQVRYNPISTTTDCAGFLCGDIALASFDTPTKNIPTWALLFSALPARDLGAAGTGYHVNLVGYGNNGTASTGSTGGIDYRRRLAENMLGGLASLDEFENFLFGGNASANPQNLYWIDFDDPRRGSAGASPFDFNAWRDNAVPGTATKTSQEGTTASGDSGGPLILDNTFAKVVVIGVLSGGYTRFFNGQPANGYGTASFYQPLYLYWDWIAANNPYHYVSAVAGNGNWTDPTHWVTKIDPAYQIISVDGQGNMTLINGVPTAAGAGNTDQPGFGEACFQSGGVSDCYNVATGTETVTATPIGQDTSTNAAGTTSNDRGNVLSSGLSDGGAASQAFSQDSNSNSGSQSSSGSQSPNALPAATLDNGLPGATNFVPNNVDPVRLTGAIGKYFDVTLTAAGTTTLDTAVTIDRFSIGIGGGNAVLDVKSTGSLTSLIDITQATGTIHANGLISTPGDYMMVSGGLDGTGTVTAAFFTSVAGTIAPGTAGTVGTLNFRGNIVLASGNTYNLDLGADGVSDKIAVAANGAGTGLANVGGRIVLNSASVAALRGNNTYTILTAAGGVSGKFIEPGSLSAILTPTFIYSANAVQLKIKVTPYGNVVDPTNPIQVSYALLLDRNRANAANYDAMYGPLDLQNQATIRSTLSALAPTTETLGQSLGIAGVDNWSGVIRTRIDGMQLGDTGGTLARYGAPTQVAANGINAMNMGGMSAMGFGADVRSDMQEPMVQEGVLPDSVSGFLAGGYLTGDSTAMTGIMGRDDYTGWYAAGGLETSGDTAMIGFALSYTRLDGTGALAGQSAHANLFQGTLYGKMNLGGATLDAMATAGLLDLHTRRDINFVGTPYSLRGDSGNLVAVTEVGLSKDFDIGSIRVTPRVAGRASHIDFSREAETGGPMALMINRGAVNSVQARGGLTIAGTGAVKPFLNGTLVHDFMDRPAVLGANFVGGVGGNVLFALNGQDKDWAEVSGGLTYETGNISFSASAETTIERQDVSSQAYRGSVSIKF